MKKHARGFMEFIREQGVVGLAIGFILGASVSRLVASLVADIINPILNVFIGSASEMKVKYFQISSIKIMWGSFLANFVDFLVIAIVVYIGFKILKLDKLDKKSAKK